MSILKFAKKYMGREAKGEKFKQAESNQPEKTEKKPPKKTAKLLGKKVGAGSDIDISLIPLVTEKGVTQQEKGYAVFRTAQTVSKGQVRQVIQARYKTEALAVKSMMMAPKIRRRGATAGHTVGWKKFYVKVADIQKLVSGP